MIYDVTYCIVVCYVCGRTYGGRPQTMIVQATAILCVINGCHNKPIFAVLCPHCVIGASRQNYWGLLIRGFTTSYLTAPHWMCRTLSHRVRLRVSDRLSTVTGRKRDGRRRDLDKPSVTQRSDRAITHGVPAASRCLATVSCVTTLNVCCR